MAGKQPPTLGVEAVWRGDRLVVARVQPAGIGWDSGVHNGDSVVGIDGHAVAIGQDSAVLERARRIDVSTGDGRTIVVSTDVATPLTSALYQATFLLNAISFLVVGGVVFVLASDLITGT